MSHVTRHTIAENDMMAAAVLISEASLAQANADCDADGMIEPIPFADAAGLQAPSGGGVLPMTVGAKKTDPWGSPYGYCVWDHGHKVKDNTCGANANRLSGGDTAVAPVIAIISAGPDRVFQTTCADWVDADTDLVVRPSGSDDVVHMMPYGQFLLPRKAEAQLGDKPDEACHEATVGTMRMRDGSVQICTDVGWTEVGTSAFADSNFEPVNNAILNHTYTTTNSLAFQGFLNRRDVAVTEGDATLVINGTPVGRHATIAAGDTIALRATSAPIPETTYTFAISVGGVRKVWTIRTRDYIPANLTITPANQAMPITTPGTPGYGGVHSFIVRNVGEVATTPFLGSQLSNITNFEFRSGGGNVGDGCAAKTLVANGYCVIDVRPRASNDGSYTGTLKARTAALEVSANLSITASGWSCTRPWGGTMAHDATIQAFQSATVPFGSTCQSQERRCSLGTLSGSYTHQSCGVAAPASCTLPWGGSIAHDSSVTAYQNATVAWNASCVSQARSCYNGTLSGTYANRTCTVTATTYRYGDWGGYSGCSATCGGGTQTRTRTCIRNNDGASVACSLCGGACSESRACNTQSCCTGLNYAGYCWHVGAIGQSCTQACSGRGGVNITGTRNYIGSAGNINNCRNVVSQLVTGVTFRDATCSSGRQFTGCSQTNGSAEVVRCYNAETTADGLHNAARRFCACNN